MGSSNSGFWIAIVLAVIAALAMIYLVVNGVRYNRRPEGVSNMSALFSPSNRRFWIMAAFPILAWMAVGFDYYDRHESVPIIAGLPVIASWGTGGKPFTYTMTINAAPLGQFKNKFKIMEIVRNNFSNVDRLSDKAIEKSQVYAIEGETIVLQHQSEQKLRFVVGQPNIVEFDLVLVPSQISANDIASLSDVAKSGGRILGSVPQVLVGASPAKVDGSQH